MVQIGEQVRVRILGEPSQPPASGAVAAILAPANDQDGDLVELTTGVVGYVFAQGPTGMDHITAQQAAAMPFDASRLNGNGANADTASGTPISGAHLHMGSHVEVQRLDSQLLEYGRVAEVFDSTPGTQPIVQLTSGTFGAVTRIESACLPRRAACIQLLSDHPDVVAAPLGAPHTVVCKVSSIIDAQTPDIIITGTITHSPAATPAASASEVTAVLTAFLLPFSPDPSPTASSTPIPEPAHFPSLPSPSRPTAATHTPAHQISSTTQAADRSPSSSQAHHSPFRPSATPPPPGHTYGGLPFHALSPRAPASPSVSATSSRKAGDTSRQPNHARAAHAGYTAAAPASHAGSLPSGRMPHEAGVFTLGDLEAGVRSLAVGALSQSGDLSGNPMDPSREAPAPGSSITGSQAATPRGGVSSEVVGVDDSMEMLWFERPEDEAAWLARQKEEAMGPRLAVLQEQCQRLGLSSDRAETLLMLIEDATVPQVLETLQKYSEHFEAAANYLLNIVASNHHPDAAAPEDACSPRHANVFQDLPSNILPPTSDPAPGPSAHPNAQTLAAASDAWGGAAAPAKRKKKKGKGKALPGCFEAVPTPYGGTVAVAHKPSHRSSLAAIVKSSQDAGPGPPPKLKQSALQPKPNKRAAVAAAFDDTLPDFLLPFIAEHVRALEAANAAAAASSAPKAQPEWTTVKGKRSPEGKAPRTPESLVTLQSTQFREQCLKELGLIAERTTERLRLLTLCSTAANQRRIYDRSAVHRLEDCTSWINRAKQAVVKAHVIAARKTRLTNIPGIIDLHLMDRSTAEQVVQGCIHELQRNLQAGDVHIITGAGNHSHNNKAHLKPLVLEIIAEAGLEHSMIDRNPGMIIMHVKP